VTDWAWEYGSDPEYVTAGLPPGVIAEVERLAPELAALGPEAAKIGRPVDRDGGLREFDILSGRGFISFLAVPRHQRVYICNITWLE
jgi:hypothetical protein